MVAESGARLLDIEAEGALQELVIPLATVITPNVPEARVIAGDGELDGEALARAVHALGPGAVVVTGGHRDEAIDVLFDGEQVVEIPGPRHPDGAAHGSGARTPARSRRTWRWATGLADAARAARLIAGEAVRDGLRGLGAGAGPVNALGVGSK